MEGEPALPHVRRPRYRRDRYRRLPFVLQDRDRAIVRTVADYRLITSAEIQALIPGSGQAILRRLQCLYHAGYLERPPDQRYLGNGKMVYALGATAYELVTGRPPFVESTALGLVLAHLHQPPADPRTFAPELPASAAEAILMALAKEPDARFATAGAFAAAM